jgi:signal recognition particle subunit SRP54
MFENLTDKLQKVFKDLRGYGKLTPENIQDALREVRLALLEADVNYNVVKEFIAAISERAVGQDVLESLTPGQQVIKIVNRNWLNCWEARRNLSSLTESSRWSSCSLVFRVQVRLLQLQSWQKC